MKSELKQKAIHLRKSGFTYSEILREIPIAKSTLTLWLRSVKLAKPQKQRITVKRRNAQIKGARRQKEKRITLQKILLNQGIKEMGNLNERDLFISGVALYWAEGSKQNENNRSQGVIFSNSDPEMIKVFLTWLKKTCHVSEKNINFELYLHESKDKNPIINYWAKKLRISPKKLNKIYLKHNKFLRKRYKGKEYHGLLRVRVAKSTNLNRKIMGWIKGIHLGVV